MRHHGLETTVFEVLGLGEIQEDLRKPFALLSLAPLEQEHRQLSKQGSYGLTPEPGRSACASITIWRISNGSKL
ncbi:hypothetical protein CEY11_16310 [Candidimonas nitroreducens]|uniref:Uncharacterized protein n=1 Tax=Candidimonas nitroreducens TaxID=683354 RepID=A0A225MBF0_9BURK|nr:hypothetical protein CEY11_16310 [Candidimonas nitroreducens]